MIRDLLRAARWLRNHRLFTIAVVLILALGIGANTAVFSVVDALLLRPLPYQSISGLVRVEETAPVRSMTAVPAQDYLLWRDRPDVFAETVAYLKDFVTITGSGDPEQVIAMRTSGGLFALLGARTPLGRTLTAADDDQGAQPVAVISDRLWQRRFHSDPEVLGRSMNTSGQLYSIAGVMPPDFEFAFPDVDVWLPLRLTPASTNALQIIARLRPGVTIAQAQSALDAVAQRIVEKEPVQKAGTRLPVKPWTETIGRSFEMTLVLVLSAVGLVLLIACADVGGLLLTRAVQRQREIAIRAALGAGKWRITRQLLAESLVLAILGSLAGIIAARYTIDFLARALGALPVVLPHVHRIALNGRVLVFSALACVALACLASLAPVLFASRIDLQSPLAGGRGSAPRGSSRLFAVLIACQAGFAFLLLAGSGLMIRSLIRLQNSDHGIHADRVLAMRVPVGTLTQPRPTGKYDTRPRQMAYYRALAERLNSVPGVRALAIVNNLPLSGVNTSTNVRGPNGQPFANSTRTVSPRYFEVMGIPVVAGRVFTEADVAGAPEVAIVNEYLARQLFAGVDPIGRVLTMVDSPNGPTIVGIVKDSPQMAYDQPPKGEVYLPYGQLMFGTFMATVLVKTTGDPFAPAAALLRAVWSVDPDQPVTRVETMDDIIAASIWRPRLSAMVFSVLGVLALVLTCTGVYAIVTYTTSLRMREVGIRVALGAQPRDVIATVMRGALVPLLIGLAISVGAALLLSRFLSGLLYEIDPADPASYVGAGALLLAIGIVASARPAWKAAITGPLNSLRTE